MPYMKKLANGKSVRDYQKQNEKYDSKPKVKRNRAMRNKAHKMMEDKIGHKTSMDVGHKKAMSKGGKTSLGNIFLQSSSSNKSFSRNKDGSMRSEISKRERAKKKK